MQGTSVKIPAFILKIEKTWYWEQGISELSLARFEKVNIYFLVLVFVLGLSGLLACLLSLKKSCPRYVWFVWMYKGIVWNSLQCFLFHGSTVRHCSQVLCSTRAAATPKALSNRIASLRWDFGFVCSSKLQKLESGTEWKECGLELQTIPHVCFVEYNENGFLVWLF